MASARRAINPHVSDVSEFQSRPNTPRIAQAGGATPANLISVKFVNTNLRWTSGPWLFEETRHGSRGHRVLLLSCGSVIHFGCHAMRDLARTVNRNASWRLVSGCTVRTVSPYRLCERNQSSGNNEIVPATRSGMTHVWRKEAPDIGVRCAGSPSRVVGSTEGYPPGR
jgi:hypothetical protein